MVFFMGIFIVGSTMWNAKAAGIGDIFQGQTHNYYVLFRGNGEAVVTATIQFTNTSDNNQSTFQFETPVAVSDMTVIQYSTNPCIGIYYDSMGHCQIPVDNMPVMIGTTDVQVGSSYAYYGQYIYQRAKFTQDGNKYTVSLPIQVASDNASYLLLGYTTKAFTSGFLGGYSFNFQSLKVDSRISAMHIGIDVDEGLLLKYATNSTVNYTTSAAAAAADTAVKSDVGVTNNTLDTIVGQVASSGMMSKDFKQLASKETANVSGDYASNVVRLFANEIGMAAGALILAAAIIFVVVKIYKKRNKNEAVKSEVGKKGGLVIADISLGFLSALAVTGFTVALFYLSSMTGFSLGYTSDYTPGMVAVSVLSLFVYIILLLFVPILRGIRKGWASFGLVMFSEIIFLIILLVFFLTLRVAIEPIYNVYPGVTLL